MLTQATGHCVDVVTNKYSSFISYLLFARLNDIKYLLGTLAYLSTLCQSLAAFRGAGQAANTASAGAKRE